MSHVTEHMRHCIDECLRCYSVCEETMTHYLQKGGKHAEANHIRTLADCAAICAASAGFMLRGSDLHPRTCDVCAEACDRCAQSCEAMADDEMMKRCAEVCRSCAKSCREMAGPGRKAA
jgi:hypothetical protein